MRYMGKPCNNMMFLELSSVPLAPLYCNSVQVKVKLLAEMIVTGSNSAETLANDNDRSETAANEKEDRRDTILVNE